MKYTASMIMLQTNVAKPDQIKSVTHRTDDGAAKLFLTVPSLHAYPWLDPPAPGPAAAPVKIKTTAGGWRPVFPHSALPPCCQYTTKSCCPPQPLGAILDPRLGICSGN